MQRRPMHRRESFLESLEPRRLYSVTSFTRTSEATVAGGADALVAADVNGDGKLDAITVNGDEGAGVASSVSVLLGNGDGTFAAPATFAAGIGAESLVAGDLNGDGKLDLVTGNVRGGDITVLLGHGDGTFSAPTEVALSNNPRALALADVSGDGTLDLAIAEEGFDSSGGDVVVLLGNGDGTFSDIGAHTTLTGLPDSLVAGDFNSDGITDLAASAIGPDGFTSQVNLLLNDGSVGFTRSNGGDLFGAVTGATAADLNGDGATDLAFSTSSGVELLFGLSDGTFTDDALITDAGAAGGVAAGDFNGDGRLDLVSGNAAGPLIGLSGSSTEFLAEQLVPGGGVSQSFAVGDLNGDGALDFVAASAYRSTVDAFTSSTTTGPALPPAIGGLDPGFGNGTGKVVNTIPTAQLTSIDTAIVQQGELLSAGLDTAGNQVVLTRYFQDGSVDLGFGGRSGVRTPIPPGFTATRVVFDGATSTLFILGSLSASGQPAVVKLAPGGYVDESFGNDGVLTLAALHPGDRADSIVSTKTGFVIGGTESVNGSRSAVILKLGPDGSLAPKGTFIVPNATGPIDTIESLAVDAKGSIFATGAVSTGSVADGSLSSSILALKLTSAGKLDKSFGEKTFAFPGYALAAGQKIVLQSDGKVDISGDVAVSETTAGQGLFGSVLIRFTAKGALDTTFSSTGSLIVSPPPTAPATTSLNTLGVVRLDAAPTGFGDLLSNRTAAASPIDGGKLRQESAQVSADNTVVTQSQIVADAANLILRTITLAGKTHKAGAKASTKLLLSNTGTLGITAAQLPVTFYLSTDATLDTTQDQPIPASELLLTLKPGSSKSSPASFTLPAGVATPVYLFAVINADGSALAELTLDDNTAHTATTFTITG